MEEKWLLSFFAASSFQVSNRAARWRNGKEPIGASCWGEGYGWGGGKANIVAAVIASLREKEDSKE